MIPGPAGEKVPLSPPWHIMLDYEFELRKKAVRRAHRSGKPLHQTLQEVTEDRDQGALLYFPSDVLGHAAAGKVQQSGRTTVAPW